MMTAEKLPPIVQVAADSTGKKLDGKIAIVTGCNSLLGIGRATATQFVRNGARAVYICDISDDSLAAQKAELEALSGGATEVHPRCFDAADEAAVSGLVDEVLERHGRLDVFFANAGRAHAAHFADTDGDDFMEVLRINSLSVFLAIKHGARAMQRTSADKPSPAGSIVVTSSVAALRSNAGSSAYSAAKAAVRSLAQTAAFQLAGTGIRCNGVSPGLIETGMTAPVFEAARARGREGRIGQLAPLGRAGVADEVARVALFLASDESSYVNGQSVAVCGGLSAGHPYVRGKLA